jgi:hypothetical protein
MAASAYEIDNRISAVIQAVDPGSVGGVRSLLRVTELRILNS